MTREFAKTAELHKVSADLIEYLQTFCRFAQDKNINIRVYGENSLSKFLSRPLEEQAAILDGFKKYANLIDSAFLAQGAAAPNQKYSEAELLKFCLGKLKLRIKSDVYDSITNDQIIELYTKEMKQVYRNLSFFKLCSYTLLDLLSYQPYELYERSLQVNHLLMEAQNELSTRAYCLEPLSLQHIPKHLTREKFSDQRLSFLIEFKEVYPVYTENNEYAGLLAIQEARPIENPDSGTIFI